MTLKRYNRPGQSPALTESGTVTIDWKRASWVLNCVGMADAWMRTFESDGWTFHHSGRRADLIPVPASGETRMSLENAVFFADCIAFDHDSPVQVRPLVGSVEATVALIDPITPDLGAHPGLNYYDATSQALATAHEIRVGQPVALRYDEEANPEPDFRTRFAFTGDALGMYAMALRQSDPLTEYLCLYRILEGPDSDNGKAFVRRRLPDLATFDFGHLGTGDAFGPSIDVFEEHRARAIARLGALHASFGDEEIAKRLYLQRNGLAHGKGNVLTNDLDVTLRNIVDDLPIVKLLARMVVAGA